MNRPDMQRPKSSSRSMLVMGLALMAGCLVATGMMIHKRSSVDGMKKALSLKQTEGRTVQVHKVALSSPIRPIQIQGEALPLLNSTLYSKTSGIVSELKAERGDQVKKGQILARLASPELDQDLRGAEADATLKTANAERAKMLIGERIISRKDFDTALAEQKVSLARLSGLKAQREYLLIRAPFDGTVTARFADPGTLVQNASSNQTSAQPLFTIARLDKLRITLFLDQRIAARVKKDTQATVMIPGQKDQGVDATISRVTGQVDPKTRMMLAEIDLDNSKGIFLAGSLVSVKIKVKFPQFPEVPVEAIIRKGEEAQLAVVEKDNSLKMRKIVIADEDPKLARIKEGLELGEQVTLNTSRFAADGVKVKVANKMGTKR